MSDPLTDEELRTVTLAFSQCRGARYFHDLSVEMEDQILSALTELRDLRAWRARLGDSDPVQEVKP